MYSRQSKRCEQHTPEPQNKLVITSILYTICCICKLYVTVSGIFGLVESKSEIKILTFLQCKLNMFRIHFQKQ